MRLPIRSWLVGALLAIAPLPAGAQPRPPRRPPPVKPKPPPKVRPTPAPGAQVSVRARTGVAAASRLLKSASTADRVRGLVRLGEVGTPAALELLAKSLEPGGVAKGFEERLTTVRALARHADAPGPRQALARAMASSATGRADDAGETLVRDTAALALAERSTRK